MRKLPKINLTQSQIDELNIILFDVTTRISEDEYYTESERKKELEKFQRIYKKLNGGSKN